MGDIEDLLKIKSFKIEFKFCEHPGKFADCNNMLIREGGDCLSYYPPKVL